MSQKLKTLVPAVNTYFGFKEIRSFKAIIKNRRQRRLLDVIGKPYKEFSREFYKKVVEQIENDILYGKETK